MILFVKWNLKTRSLSFNDYIDNYTRPKFHTGLEPPSPFSEGTPLFLKQILKVTPSFWDPPKLVYTNFKKHFKMKVLRFVLY